MSDERTKKQNPREQRGQEREVQAARGQRRQDEQRKRDLPDPNEREWRGAGVCGGRHTD